MTHVQFTPAGVKELARDRERYVLRRLENEGGFGFPQRRWIHEAVGSYYANDRNPARLTRSLSEAMLRGQGRNSWKVAREPALQRMLRHFALVEPRARGIVRTVLYRREAPPVLWQDHWLAFPMGLLVEEMAGRFVRVFWIEAGMGFRARGSTMVVAATLAHAETLLGGQLTGIDVWQLRHRQERFFRADDLRRLWSRLDGLMTFAESRLREPPAA